MNTENQTDCADRRMQPFSHHFAGLMVDSNDFAARSNKGGVFTNAQTNRTHLISNKQER